MNRLIKRLSLGLFLFLIVSGVAIALLLRSCNGSVQQYGDVSIRISDNLMGHPTYALETPKFSLGKQHEIVYRVTGLPHPALPVALVVPSPGYAEKRPGYLKSVLEVSFEDQSSVAFYSTRVDLEVLGREGNYWPSSVRLYPHDQKPKLAVDYQIRIKMLKPSSDPGDRAYLYAGGLDLEKLH